MAQKDITTKTLEAYNDVFADIVNVLLFKGKKVLRPNALQDALPKSQYKFAEKVHEEERDVAKFCKQGNVRIAFYGLENQTAIDKDMALRVIAYDGAVYRGQLLDKKEKKRYPAITLVLYFGDKHWTKYKKLTDCFDTPKEFKPYINEYKLHIYEIAHLSRKTVDLFQSDFKIVADYYWQKKHNKEYNPSKQTIRHVDEILKLMKVVTGDERFEEVAKQNAEIVYKGKGGTNMCEMLDRMIKKGEARGEARGRAEGEASGMAKGRAEGRAEEKSFFVEMMLRANEPVSKIRKYTKLPLKKIKELADSIGVAVVM